MGEEITVLCDVDRNPMEMVQYGWQLGSGSHEKTFMRCPECNRHYAPLHGYVDIKDRMLESKNRKFKLCPDQVNEPHYSMAIVGFEGDEPVWKCLHRECRAEK